MVTAETLERITVITEDTLIWSEARELCVLLARSPQPVDDIYDIIDSYLWALRRVNTELLYPRDR